MGALAAGFAAAALLSVTYPGPAPELPSPDGRMRVVNEDRDDADPPHALRLHFADGKPPKVVLRYGRSVDVTWSGDSRWLLVTDRRGSDESTCWVIPVAGGHPVDVLAAFRREPREYPWLANHHVYVACETWIAERIAIVRVEGWGDAAPQGFSARYRIGYDEASGSVGAFDLAPDSPDSKPPPPPEGWALVALGSLDTISAAFHDRATGLFVLAESGGGGDIGPAWKGRPAAARVRAVRAAGRDAELLVEPDAFGCREHHLRVPIGEPLGRAVYFDARICTETEEDRWNALIAALPYPLGDQPPPRGPGPVPIEADVAALRIGEDWSAVRSRFGYAEYADAMARGSFRAVYSVGDGEVSLVFDRDQRLAEVVRKPATIGRD